jgi:hypothetical protein
MARLCWSVGVLELLEEEGWRRPDVESGDGEWEAEKGGEKEAEQSRRRSRVVATVTAAPAADHSSSRRVEKSKRAIVEDMNRRDLDQR